MNVESLAMPPVDLMPDEQPPARLLAGALAHLARHVETGYPALRKSSIAAPGSGLPNRKPCR